MRHIRKRRIEREEEEEEEEAADDGVGSGSGAGDRSAGKNERLFVPHTRNV